MATARKKSRAAASALPGAREASLLESMEFLIFEDNGGDYHWTIVTADGAALAGSAGFPSYEDADRAARHVRDRAGSARIERRPTGGPPVDLGARRNAIGDAADAERWLDERASAGNGVVAKWPAPR